MRPALLLSALVLAAAGCGGGSAGRLTVGEAVASDEEGPVLVEGLLIQASDGPPRLCEAILESYPPQCGGPSLLVEGLDVQAFPGVQTASGVSWVEGAQIAGTIADGVITAQPAAS